MTDAEWSKLYATDLEYSKFVFADTAVHIIKAAAIYAAALGLFWTLA